MLHGSVTLPPPAGTLFVIDNISAAQTACQLSTKLPSGFAVIPLTCRALSACKLQASQHGSADIRLCHVMFAKPVLRRLNHNRVLSSKCIKAKCAEAMLLHACM